MLNLQNIKESFLNLFYPGEKYLVVEILDHYIQAAALKARLEENPASKQKGELMIMKVWQRPLRNLSAPEALKETAALLKKVGKLSGYKIILSLDSRLATTIYSSIPLVRQNPNEAIDEPDIDNLVSQAIWRFFDRQREKIAKKMGVEDIDVLLSDVRIRGIKIDGHKVINPIGFKAKSVEFYFSQTFVVRDFIRGLREMLPMEQVAFVAEIGTVLANAALKILSTDHLFLANLFPSQTVIYTASPGKLGYLDRYGWGQNNLISHFKNNLFLEPEITRTVIDLYNKSKTSPLFLRRLENILIKELQIFLYGLESVVDKEQAKVYLNPYFDLPAVTFSQRCQARLTKPLKICPLSSELSTEKFGFDVKFNKSVKAKNLLTILAMFAELGSLSQDEKLGHLVKRRVRWLH